MRQFVESLKRLYGTGKVTKEKIEILCEEKKIDQDEVRYILG